MQEYLPYPEKIYAREGDGIAHLKIFNLPNVQRTFDSVLLGPEKLNRDNNYKTAI